MTRQLDGVKPTSRTAVTEFPNLNDICREIWQIIKLLHVSHISSNRFPFKSTLIRSALHCTEPKGLTLIKPLIIKKQNLFRHSNSITMRQGKMFLLSLLLSTSTGTLLILAGLAWHGLAESEQGTRVLTKVLKCNTVLFYHYFMIIYHSRLSLGSDGTLGWWQWEIQVAEIIFHVHMYTQWLVQQCLGVTPVCARWFCQQDSIRRRPEGHGLWSLFC